MLEFILFKLSIIVKLIISVICGLIIGKERKKNDKPGGARTFGLICMGACNIGLLTLFIASQNVDTHNYTRLMAYGLASIGFIGSGVIIQNKHKVDGVTTASTLWATVIIGYLVGLGHFFWAILNTILVYQILELKYKE